jgi:hypothetical protein
MKAILKEQGFPKILRVGEELHKKSYNKYLRDPFVVGELVKVIPFKEQKSYVTGKDKMEFLRQFVNVIRKDKNGDWSMKYTCTWDILEPIGKNK